MCRSWMRHSHKSLAVAYFYSEQMQLSGCMPVPDMQHSATNYRIVEQFKSRLHNICFGSVVQVCELHHVRVSTDNITAKHFEKHCLWIALDAHCIEALIINDANLMHWSAKRNNQITPALATINMKHFELQRSKWNETTHSFATENINAKTLIIII